MAFKVNFSDVESFEPIPAGVYAVAVVDMEEQEGKAGPYFKTTLEIMDGEFSGRKLWSNLSLSPKAAWKLQEALIAFGEDADDLTGDFEFDPEKYLGVECSAAVEQSIYDGKITNSVSSFIAPGGKAEKGKAVKSAAPAGKKPKIR